MKSWWPRAHEKYWWQCGGGGRGGICCVCVCFDSVSYRAEFVKRGNDDDEEED